LDRAGRGVDQTQGLYQLRAIQTEDTHHCSQWDSNPQTQYSSGRSRYKYVTAQPLYNKKLHKPRKVRSKIIACTYRVDHCLVRRTSVLPHDYVRTRCCNDHRSNPL